MTTKVTNIYNLKLTPSQFGQSSLVVNCSQYDSLFRVIQFNLFNGNAVYSIPEGSVVTIRGTKKDNTGFEYECDYYNNVVTFPLQQQITIFPGKVPAELRITNNGEIIGSWNFLFLVEESPLPDDTIISETDLPLLQSALQAAAEAENYKNLAQISADNASASEQNASESEANALTYSQNAQTSANSASQSEANALTYSQNASASASEAQGYAQDAEDSATQSADSATQASQSATTAQTIADNIADLVDEAQGYASQSLTNAQNSAQSASQASQSATNASQSASNAQTYASNANTSAQNASSSATSAQTYAGNASTSATQSASSATASAQSATNAQTYANNASASASQAQGYASNASDSATASADSATESQGYAQNASDSATEAQEAVDTIDEAIKNKADIDGVYPKLVAGDLVESETKDDVFTYQVTDHTGEANINSIKGNTIVWNQLIENVASKTADGITTAFNASNGLFSITNDSRTTNFSSGSNSNVLVAHADCVANHKYFINVDKNISGLSIHTGAQQFYLIPIILQYQGTGGFYIRVTSAYDFVSAHPVGDVTSFHIYITDLTVMFGAGNEPSTPEEFTSLFPLSYYSYNQGSLLSFNGNGIKTVGFNQWDEEWEVGAINAQGQPSITADRIRSKNFIPVMPNTTYYRKSPNNIQPFFYDANQQFIEYGFWNTGAFPTPSNCAYMKFQVDPAYGLTYKNDICINISSSKNGTYEPYKDETLSLPIATYFPNGMRSAGSVYDELTPTKAITRIGVVDLGTLTWTQAGTSQSDKKRFATYDLHGLYVVSSASNVKADFTCSKYVTMTADDTYLCKNGISSQTSGYIYIYDDAYSSATAEDFKASLSGAVLYYATVTPTETDVDLDLSYSTYEGGTEQLLPANTDVPVTSPISMNVEFDFGENLNARLNKMLSCLAQVETSPSTHNYSVGDYLMYEYQLYKVTSAITTGQSLTVGTNIVATTVMSELLSLTA